MARILFKTTIPNVEDDWHVGRFSLAADHLRRLGHDVRACDRMDADTADEDIAAAACGEFDQLWLFGVDTGSGLCGLDIIAIDSFRKRGGGLLISRDHQDLGSCLSAIPGIGETQHFQTRNPEADPDRQRIDDTGTPALSWPNYHSGSNGDVQEIATFAPLHPLVSRADGKPIRWLPSHPHEGAVSAPEDLVGARVVATGRSITTHRDFNLVVAIEQPGAGRVVADSSFHHFADCNLDPAAGAPTFVDEPWGDEITRNPEARADAHRYIANIADWLSPNMGRAA